MQWAESLFRELDYRREAANGVRFKALYGTLEVLPQSSFTDAKGCSTPARNTHMQGCMLV